MTQLARVGVVVLNHFGGDRTLKCVARIQLSSSSLRNRHIVVVDNGGEPGFATALAGIAPEVRLITLPKNVGFAAGCNAGIRVLDDVEFIALVNNDVLPESGWLERLAEVLARRPGAGAVVPKVLLQARYRPVSLSSSARRPGMTWDRRELGVQLCGARVNGVEMLNSTQLRAGFWGWESNSELGRFAWTDGHGELHVPSRGDQFERLELRLVSTLGRVQVTVASNGSESTLVVDERPRWLPVESPAPAVDVLNNAGTCLHADGTVSDRGYLEVDRGQYERPAEVFGWSGATVLLRTAYLADAGLFDEAFFLYSEDADLSWRGRLLGWSHWYEPSAVVRHEHSATVGEGSALAQHLLARNRLLTLLKNAPLPLLMGSLRRLLADLLAAIRDDVFRRLARGRPPLMSHVTAAVRVLLGFIVRTPAALRSRFTIRQRARIADREIMAWVDCPAVENIT